VSTGWGGIPLLESRRASLFFILFNQIIAAIRSDILNTGNNSQQAGKVNDRGIYFHLNIQSYSQ